MVLRVGCSDSLVPVATSHVFQCGNFHLELSLSSLYFFLNLMTFKKSLLISLMRFTVMVIFHILLFGYVFYYYVFHVLEI